MSELDYTLFSYYWFFRLETVIYISSIIATTLFIIIKFIANRTIGGFAISIQSNF
jgi:hypothetical protein